MANNSNVVDLKSIQEKIKQLYKFRDEFYLSMPKEKFGDKQTIIDEKTSEILAELNEINVENVDNKAMYYFIKGWLLNIKESYDQNVFDFLTKSIKFNPEYEEAWLELGECYFKKSNLELALNCFEKVTKMNPNEKRALRNTSIMLRSIQSTGDKRKNDLLKSIELAKKAVECDLDDKDSWAILGNAYLTLLFMTNGKRDQINVLLNKCKTSYQKALLDDKVKTKSDVLYNYSSLLQYEEDFEQSLQCLSDAFLYDPAWSELKQKKERLLTFLNDICHCRIDRTVIKPKKLQSIKEQLKCEERNLKTLYGDKEQYYNGRSKLIQDLQEGFNDCLLVLKIVSYVTDSHNIFFCSVYYSIDSEGHTITLFIYDIVKNKGPRQGDSVLILRPFIKEYHIKFENHEFSFKAIRIVDPMQELLVNNQPLSHDCLAMPTINVTLKSD